MGGCRCSYKSCRSATKTTENLHFFHYPVKHRDRCAIWIKNADKPQFANLPDYQLRNKVICGLHFEDKYFANVEKRRLVHNAIPTLDAGCDSTSDDLSYIKEVEIVPTSTDGTTFTLHSQHLQPGPSIRKEKLSVHNGKVIIQQVPTNSQPEVYTIDPSYFTQSFYNNKNIKEVVINSTTFNADSNDSEIICEEHIESEENCMMIYDTQESNNSDALSIEKQDETGVHYITTTDTAAKIEHLFFDDEDEEDEKNVMDTVEIEDTKGNIIINDIGDNTNASSASQYSLGSNEASHHDSSNGSSPTPTSTTHRVVNRTVMKRINNHAQEIANIKRSLAGSGNSLRLTNKHLVRSLKGRIPDSLLGVISLHLNKRRNVITKEEQEYAKVIKSIPAAGNIVLKNNGWYMPLKNDSLNIA